MAIHDANLAKLPKKAKFFLVGATTSATNGFAERANEPIEAVRVVMECFEVYYRDIGGHSASFTT